MPATILSNSRGVAVLLAVTVTVVLVAISVETHRSSRNAALSAAMARNRVQLVQTAASGVYLGMAVLVEDKTTSRVDSLLEDWADAEQLGRRARLLEFETAHLSLSISDEKAKIQVNALVAAAGGQAFNPVQMRLWERLLERLGDLREDQPGPDVQSILSAAKDWMDSGDDDAVTGLNGAESDYYRMLSPPYRCRNGPLLTLEELQLIRGIDAALFEGGGRLPGLTSMMTVYGAEVNAAGQRRFPGTININTASTAVLETLLPREQRDLADAIADYRQAAVEAGDIEDFSRPTWYRNAPGCGELTIDPQLLTTVSDLFRIEATASMQDLKLTVVAVVERVKADEGDGWKCRILNWRMV